MFCHCVNRRYCEIVEWEIVMDNEVRADRGTTQALDAPRIVPLSIAARRLRVRISTLRDRRWRERAGIPLTRLGTSRKILGVAETDIIAALRRGRERLNGDDAA